MIRPCGTGGCHFNACLLRLVNDLLRAAFHSVKADEISALRSCPRRDTKAAEILIKNLLNRFELRPDNVRMLSHVLGHSVNVFKEAYMAKLIDLVISDRLVLELSPDVFQIVRRCGKRRDTAARESNLRR